MQSNDSGSVDMVAVFASDRPMVKPIGFFPSPGVHAWDEDSPLPRKPLPGALNRQQSPWKGLVGRRMA